MRSGFGVNRRLTASVSGAIENVFCWRFTIAGIRSAGATGAIHCLRLVKFRA